MSEEKTLATTGSNLPAGVNEDILKQLKEGSGESTRSFAFVPVLQVDNLKEDKIIDGNEEQVLCQPRWKLTKKVEEELVTEPFEKGFLGVILSIRYQVTKKYEKTSTMPFFYSQEFSPAAFQDGSKINLKFMDEGKTTDSLTYKEIKVQYAEKYTLTSILYVWHDNSVKKIKIHGAAMSALWDYLKLFKGKDSVSAHVTAFGTKRVKLPQPYNTVDLSISEDTAIVVDWQAILEAQKELNTIFNSYVNKVLEAMGGEVVAEEDNDEIRVENVPM